MRDSLQKLCSRRDDLRCWTRRVTKDGSLFHILGSAKHCCGTPLVFFPVINRIFLNDRKKLSQFGHNVRKYTLLNTVTASFILLPGLPCRPYF